MSLFSKQKKGVNRNRRATYHRRTGTYARSFYRKSKILNGTAEPLSSSQYKSWRRKETSSTDRVFEFAAGINHLHVGKTKKFV
jgi:hypothetical protein